MEKILFHDIEFIKQDQVLLLTKFCNFESCGYESIDISLAGRNKDSSMANKLDKSSEGRTLLYHFHEITENKLKIYLKNDVILASIEIEYINNNKYLVSSLIKNISNEEQIIEEAPTIKLVGFDKINKKDIYYTRFIQSHHYECMEERTNLEFLTYNNGRSQRRIKHTNVGSWTTKEMLPQGIIEYNSSFLNFEVLSRSCWHIEISDKAESIYLSLGYPSIHDGGFTKKLKPNEIFKCLPVRFGYANSLIETLNLMNELRRMNYHPSSSDKDLPVIFNEYMHLSWDSPFEERTLSLAPLVSTLGADYYVIDCGWHNEEPGDQVYPYVGQWKESHVRFPRGIKYIKEELNKLGLKLGLWIEPEIIGHKCTEMLNYYDDDCFLKRNNKRIFVMGRYFLDYRNKKVINYMEETFRRMIEDYGACYIKMDYNEDIGIGCDDEDCFILGYQKANEAFITFVERMKQKYPHVVFEGCASGGMRLDSTTVSTFSLVSTSDQVNYKKYPIIVGNIFTQVIPEQAAVWSYPVNSHIEGFTDTKEFVNNHISKNEVVINMVNGLLGRMHLASHLECLDEEKRSLVKEGIAYYKKMIDVKRGANILLPFGFSHFTDDVVCVGITNHNKCYLGVWSLNNKNKIVIPFRHIKNATVGYPTHEDVIIEYDDTNLYVYFKTTPFACALEIEY